MKARVEFTGPVRPRSTAVEEDEEECGGVAVAVFKRSFRSASLSRG